MLLFRVRVMMWYWYIAPYAFLSQVLHLTSLCSPHPALPSPTPPPSTSYPALANSWTLCCSAVNCDPLELKNLASISFYRPVYHVALAYFAHLFAFNTLY
jgi:hypothetical protein